MIRSYYALIWTDSGLLLGGSSRHKSSTFSHREDAEDLLIAMLATNRDSRTSPRVNGMVVPSHQLPVLIRCCGSRGDVVTFDANCSRCGVRALPNFHRKLMAKPRLTSESTVG